MRFIAVDLGDKRTGLALGDDETGLATPAEVIEVPIAGRGGEDLLAALVRAIGELVSARAACGLVVGLPVNMDGTEGQRAKAVRAFAARLGAATGREVFFQDERLTSAAADWSMSRSGLTRGEKKARRDAMAAAEILKDFLAQRAAARRAGAGGEAGNDGSEPDGGFAV